MMYAYRVWGPRHARRARQRKNTKEKPEVRYTKKENEQRKKRVKVPVRDVNLVLGIFWKVMARNAAWPSLAVAAKPAPPIAGWAVFGQRVHEVPRA